MIATEDPEEFLASPMGRCVVAPNFAVWCHSPDLQGSLTWGVIDERSIRDMVAVGQYVYRPGIATRRRVLTDCRDVERADADVLMAFSTNAREWAPIWSWGIERQAMIVPQTLGGMMMSGSLPLAGADHAMRMVHDLDEALAFLDHPDAAAAHATATSLVAEVRGRPVLLSRLRAHLHRALDAATVETAAKALGLSRRTLQRELGRLGTSFSDELLRARIAAAQALLAHTELKVETIASQVGFGTASRMSASLRREVNMTATEWRKMHS